jgi:hypothetical protein
MAYKSKGGCTPITAKIKRTTKGGITQPLLNVGAPVKMKAPTPAKQTSAGEDFSKAYEANQLAKTTAANEAKAKKTAKSKANYNKKLTDYRSNLLSQDSNKSNIAKEYRKSARAGDIAARDYRRQSESISKFEKNLFDYDSKKNPKLTEGHTAKSYALSKAKGTTKTIKTTDNSSGGGSSKSNSSKGGGSKGGGSKQYKTSMKNFKIGSQARRDEYTKRGWKQDDTTKVARKKTEPVSTTTARPVSISNKSPEVDVKVTKKTTTKKDARKSKSIDKKQNKANTARAKGNEKKALRKERAIERKKVRLSKRKGSIYSQSANAINPS